MRLLTSTTILIVFCFSWSPLIGEIELPISEIPCEDYNIIDNQPINNSGLQNATPSITHSGQSFVPTEEFIGGVSVSYNFSNVNDLVTLELRSGSLPDTGPYAVLGTATCQRPFSTTALTLNFEFASPVPVVIGDPYYFVFTDVASSSGLQLNTDGNSYPFGRFVRGNATSVSEFPASYDLVWATYNCDPPVAPIPTMSQWMLFILGLIMTSLAVVYIKKQQWAV